MVLGTAAGGGFPQWNCACANCRLAREGALAPRLQSSVAISGNGRDWHLVNASPDVSRQMELHIRPRLPAGGTARESPIRGVFLTNADLDHTLGLFQLREGGRLAVTAPAAVRASLENGPALSRVIGAYTEIDWRLASGEWIAADATGLEVRAVPLEGAGPPRYALQAPAAGHAAGYLFRDARGTAGVFPDVAMLDGRLRAEIAGCDRVWFDGTFWDGDELVRLGFSKRNAAGMGHVPISGAGGSLALLSALGPHRAAYLHINNTNPVLRPGSVERKALEAAQVRVAEDGEHFVVSA